jgi:hypothetical protein
MNAIAAHLTTVADVLHELAAEIEDLGTVLCIDIGDDAASADVAIHRSDRAEAALAGHIAAADCPLSAVNTIGVEALKARFSPRPN